MSAANIVILTEANFDQEVLKSPTPVLVDFWAEWCGPCKMIAPILDELASEYDGKVKVGKVNVDENSELAMKYDITTIPRVLVFKGSDRPLHQIVGLTGEGELTRLLDNALAP